MVNVGGRSKGCSTCRRRRVKCDETRPVCSRCQRCGFECDGAKEITFIEGKIVRSRRTEKRTTISTRCDDRDTNPAGRQMIPLSPSLKAHEFEISICYSRKHLRRGGAIDLQMQKLQLSDIIMAGTTTANSQIFPHALLSFASIVFGAQHGQASITDRGCTIHGIALKQLNQALSESKCYTRDEVILSVATLAILESLVPTGTKSYLNHMIGLERLLELRDPRSHCSPESSNLYKSVRHMMLFASLLTGRPSILARAEWKTVLRASCSEEELPEQDLYDVLADLTVLVAERDTVLANWELDLEKASHQRDKIKRETLTLLNHLRAWRRRWGRDERNSYFETPAASATLARMQESGADDSPHSPAVFEFSNKSAAEMLMFYNTTLIYVLRVLASLPLETFGPYSNQSFTYTEGDYIAAERLAALEICRCIPYYSDRKSHSDSGSPIVHWAVTTAWTTLSSNDSSEGRSMMDLVNTESRQITAKGLWAD